MKVARVTTAGTLEVAGRELQVAEETDLSAGNLSQRVSKEQGNTGGG
jgi:hypothetical protein